MRERYARDLAIVGMACVFPGAPDLDTYRRNIEAGYDAITDVPPNRWDPVFYDPASNAVDRFYCKRGGFIDDYATFDSLAFGVMPVAAQGAEPDQLLTLQVASRALADAGYDRRAFPRGRTSVVLGRGNYIGAGMTRLEQHVRTAEQLTLALRGLIPGLGEEQLAAVKREFQSQLGGYGPDTAIGLVPNLTASRIANRLDLHGPAYTIDGACASSLLAVDQACRDLADGRVDLSLVGGVHLSHDVAFWSVFCQLGALSRSEQIRPFDRRADGLLIGEGLGVVVLKRLADAERDGDRVYAVIRACGVASDGREASLMTPRVDGQVLALRRAWRAAGLDPETVGLVEAHGTGTPAGDDAELATLASFFGGARGRRVGLGSVKSMIGHTMPASGIAALIKAALAVYHGLLPPSLHCEEPHERLEDTCFRVVQQAEPWEKSGVPRRAGVNAFGFGGINAHVILEAYGEGGMRGTRSTPANKPTEGDAEELLVLAGPEPAALLAALQTGRDDAGGGPCRLALVNPTAERRARAQKIVERGAARRGRDGIWFSPRGLVTEGAKVAFLFPGAEAAFQPRADDVARHFGLPPPPHPDAGNIEQLGAAIVSIGRLLHHALAKIGVHPDVIAGHSIGEWSGMIASGAISERSLDALLANLVPGSLEVPGVVFAAAGCNSERATDAVTDLEDIAVSHDNCPHQIVLCGKEEAVDVACRRLRAGGVLCQKLPFRSGFHSPLFTDFVAPHQKRLAELEIQTPEIPLWSATTCAPYPSAPDGIRTLAVDHLVRPVRFRELIRALYDDGVRIFVQVGTGSLVGFVEDTLRGLPHLAISTSLPQRAGVTQLRRLAAALFVEGVPVDLEPLEASPKPKGGRPVRLELGVPLVRMSTPLAVGAAVPTSSGEHPVLREFDSSLRELAIAQQAVLQAWEGRVEGRANRPVELPRGPRQSTTRREFSVRTMPALEDHCLFPQPPGWPHLVDRRPVVPMTTSIAMMLQAAADLVPQATPIGIERVRAYRWLVAEPPASVNVSARFDGVDRVKVSIEGYTEGTVLLGPAYPPAPNPDVTSLEAEEGSPLTAAQLYDEGWMFHGPRFQGVRHLGPVGSDGIRGVLEVPPSLGGLLDNAGQLLGLWVMLRTDKDRLAMPIKVEGIELYGPEPAVGERLECTVRIRHLGPKEVRGDIELCAGDRVWARVQGWEDRRFDTDERLWPVMRQPDLHLLGVPTPEGFCVLTDVWRSAPSREYLLWRYLGQDERAQYERVGPRRQRQWLNGRIAAKDAARHWLSNRGADSLFPVELTIDSEPSGRPTIRGRFDADLRVSLAHSDHLAVAVVAEGQEVGIDLERVEPRPEGFERTAFGAAEAKLLPDENRDEWVTRFWTAKEAISKRRGTGLGGNPQRFAITEVAGERLCVDGECVETRRLGEHVVAWTVAKQ